MITLKFGEVSFDGHQGNPSWSIEDELVHVVFDSCIFKNHPSHSSILNGANVEIINSHFSNFNCNESLFLINDGAKLDLVNVHFNSGVGLNTNIITSRNATISLYNATFTNNTNIDTIIYAMDSLTKIQFSSFSTNKAIHLMNIDNSGQEYQRDCTSNFSTILISNNFIQNHVESLIKMNNLNAFINGNTLNQNLCNNICVQSSNSSLPLDISDRAFNTVFSDISTICMDGNNINSNDSVLIFDGCIEPFSITTTSIIPPKLSTFNTSYINSVAGGAVLQSFECYDYMESCMRYQLQ